jgi:hypothetical protein
MDKIEKIFNILQSELSHNLSGILLFNDADTIRWELDGIHYGNSREDLEDLATDDISLIKEVLFENDLDNSVEISDIEFDDTYVYFNIEEL